MFLSMFLTYILLDFNLLICSCRAVVMVHGRSQLLSPPLATPVCIDTYIRPRYKNPRGYGSVPKASCLVQQPLCLGRSVAVVHLPWPSDASGLVIHVVHQLLVNGRVVHPAHSASLPKPNQFDDLQYSESPII